MGILNVTPDSFSGDGLLTGADAVQTALSQARSFIEAGVDILDVGGESTRPGAELVTEAEEMERVVPVIKALVQADFGALISVDTYKARVANAALNAGAHWVNDVWGLRADPEMAAVVSRHKVPVVLMHNRSKPGNAQLQDRLGGRYIGIEYNNLLEDVKDRVDAQCCPGACGWYSG